MPGGKLETKAAFARLAGRHRTTVFNAAKSGKPLAAALVDGKIDTSHPAALAYLARGAATAKHRGAATVGKSGAATPTPAGAVPGPIEHFAHLSLVYAIRKYGTDPLLMDLAIAHKQLADVTSRELGLRDDRVLFVNGKRAETVILTAVAGAVERLEVASDEITAEIYRLAGDGAALEEGEAMAREAIGLALDPLRKTKPPRRSRERAGAVESASEALPAADITTAEVSGFSRKKIRELYKLFGTAANLKQWIAARKRMGDTADRLRRNAVQRGAIVDRAKALAAFSAVEESVRRLIADTPKTLAARAFAWHDSSTPLAEAQATAREIVASQIEPTADRVWRAFRPKGGARRKTVDTYDDDEGIEDDDAWLGEMFAAIATRVETLTPSEWAEANRYLSPAATSQPGLYRFDVTPFLREPLDALGPRSSVRSVALVKGAQIGATVGVLENLILFNIAHVKTSPMLMVTATAELAKMRVATYILPAIEQSGLSGCIAAADEGNKRKTGKTATKVSWQGGGYLASYGALSASKLRSISIQTLMLDEVDAYPQTVGKDGDPVALAADRTASFEKSRKILALSTPLLRGQSKIDTMYEAGDQRQYHVPCLGCGLMQELRWKITDEETGEISGFVWEVEDGRLVPGSTRFKCPACGHLHRDADKTKMMAPESGARWVPMAVPSTPNARSYRLSALYSPVGMRSWDSIVAGWLEAWDEERGRPRDMGKLQAWYNGTLGQSFRLRGEQVRFETVSAHRRLEYRYGEVPNVFARANCGGPVVVLTCSVDVHKDNLAVAVFGWTRGRRALLVDYWRFDGVTERIESGRGEDPTPWERLRKVIEDTEYTGDDGARYRIELTLVDSGYQADIVYRFCAEYSSGVVPVKGRDEATKGAVNAWSQFTTREGQPGFTVSVSFYKDRWAAALRRSWDDTEMQPGGHFNAPFNATDKQLKELTVESRREKVNERTGLRVGFYWHRSGGSPNELWDTLIYATAALEMLAHDYTINQLGGVEVVWPDFFDACENEALFFEPG